jgi:cyclic pyranopterin phosphate synthase
MKDQQNREIDYLRISITDRCNLSCKYCKPDHAGKLLHEDILTYEEIIYLSNIFIQLGINRFKITGGEPFVRKECLDFVKKLKMQKGVCQVTMTSNGILLGKWADVLKDADVDGINVSLDYMKREKYAEITGADCMDQVLENLKTASQKGLYVKINKVLEEDDGMDDILPFLEFIKQRDIAVRFIEKMPFHGENTKKPRLNSEKILREIQNKGIVVEKVQKKIGNGPASYYRMEGYEGLIGFIEATHGKFCSSCNRVRMTSTGKLKPCLYHSETLDLKELLRNHVDREIIKEKIKETIYEKPHSHRFEEKPVDDFMYTIGG